MLEKQIFSSCSPIKLANNHSKNEKHSFEYINRRSVDFGNGSIASNQCYIFWVILEVRRIRKKLCHEGSGTPGYEPSTIQLYYNALPLETPSLHRKIGWKLSVSLLLIRLERVSELGWSKPMRGQSQLPKHFLSIHSHVNSRWDTKSFRTSLFLTRPHACLHTHTSTHTLSLSLSLSHSLTLSICESGTSFFTY